MQHKLLGFMSLLFSLFLFAVPASAFDLNQCSPFPTETTEFTLIAQDNVIFEAQQANSGRIIQGNVLVTSTTVTKLGSPEGTGFAKVGANTVIDGTLIAKEILLPDGGGPGLPKSPGPGNETFSIRHCIADIIVANTPAARAMCGTGFPVVGTPFTTYATTAPTSTCVGNLTVSAICGATPAVNHCTDGLPKLTVTTLSPPDLLATGCYGALVIDPGAVLNLAANGVYIFASVDMGAGAKLNGGCTAPGACTGTSSTVNVNGKFLTNAGVFITNINLNVAAATTAEVVKLRENSTETNVVINAPLGKCHLHTGSSLLACSEACCKVLDVEPIIAECEGPPGAPCVCPAHFKFEVPLFPAGAADKQRNCVACEAGDGPGNGNPTCP